MKFMFLQFINENNITILYTYFISYTIYEHVCKYHKHIREISIARSKVTVVTQVIKQKF